MITLPRIPALVVLTAVALLTAACGSGSDKSKPAITKPKAADICPEGGAWDANALLGKKEPDAEQLAKDNSCTMRVTERDGKGLPVTMDFRSERVNVSVDQGVVTKVTGTG